MRKRDLIKENSDLRDSIAQIYNKYEKSETKLSKLLYHVTSGKYSKTDYTIQDMRRFADDELDRIIRDNIEETSADNRKLAEMLEKARYDLKSGWQCSSCKHRRFSIVKPEKQSREWCLKYSPTGFGFYDAAGPWVTCGGYEWNGITSNDNEATT